MEQEAGAFPKRFALSALRFAILARSSVTLCEAFPSYDE